MIVDSFFFKGHNCFKSSYSGLDEFKPITVVIGRNNSGKSQLLDVIEALTASSLNEFKFDYSASGILDKESLLRAFPENLHGGDLPGHGGYWQDHGQRYLNQRITWEYCSATKEIEVHSLSGVETQHSAYEGARKLRLAKIVRNAITPFSNRVYRRLMADRDMRPESASTGLSLEPGGFGATNIIRRYVLAHDPMMMKN